MRYIFWIFVILFLSPVNLDAAEQDILVKFKENTFSISNSILKFNSKKIKENLYLVKNGDLEKIKRSPNVKYAEPNFTISLDPVIESEDGEAWGIEKIQAKRLWEEKIVGSKDIVVAVIDTGVDYTHEALKGNIWTNEKEIPNNGVDDDENGFVDDIHGWDFANGDADPMDDNNHGTHCSGIIGGKGVGVAKNVKIMALKFLTHDGKGDLLGAVQSIEYARKMGADIMSNSWGASGFTSKILEDQIKEAEKAGIIFVAAAGNEYHNNDTTPTYPASFKLNNVISVAATDKEDKKAWFSNWGETVHVAAPGVVIYSSVIGNKYKTYSGTSMAAPHVTGLVVLLLQGGYDPMKIRDLLIESSDSVSDLKGKVKAKGRVNAYRAYHNFRMNVE